MSVKNIRSFSPIPIFLGVLLLWLGLSSLALSEDLSGRWSIGLEGGINKLTEGYWDYSNVDQFGGISFSRSLTPYWNTQFALRYGQVRPGVDTPGNEAGWTFDSFAPLYTTMWQPSLMLQHRFAPYSRFCPTIGFGLGMTSWKVLNMSGESPGLFPSGETARGFDINGEEMDLSGNNFTISLELGIDYFITDSIAFNIGGRYHLIPGNEIDNIGFSSFWGPDHVDANTAIAQGFVGFTMWFGNTDWDEDGIKNKLDKCPTAAEDFDGFQDEDGCPEIDNDGDRIIDAQDGCPDEAEDIDGFQDQDGCPDPDNDGDGVLDDNDLCPDSPAGAEVDDSGCSVTTLSAQPEVETPSSIPAVVAAPAAPFAAAVVYADDSYVLEGVNFKSGSAQLTPESITVLAKIAARLRETPNTKYEIRGHTDSSGPSEDNRDLSLQRAISVRDSLIQMGVNAANLSAIGYGEDFPLTSNDTRSGRKKNRRVELYKI